MAVERATTAHRLDHALQGYSLYGTLGYSTVLYGTHRLDQPHDVRALQAFERLDFAELEALVPRLERALHALERDELVVLLA